MEFSKDLIVNTTLENSKPAGADEFFDEVQNQIFDSAKCGLWKVEVKVEKKQQPVMLWVAAKLKRMGFELVEYNGTTFTISWQNY